MNPMHSTPRPPVSLTHRLATAVLAMVLLVGFCLTTAPAAAQVKVTEHTLKLDEGQKQPPATLEDVAWLVGSWQGEAFGGTIEEYWHPPSGGTMMGLFKLMNGGENQFYEFMLLVEEEGSLVMKLKHFHPDLKGWEEKDDYVSFPLVKVTEEGLYFRGLTFLRKGENEIQGYLALKSKGEVREEALAYRRVSSSPAPKP